MEEADYVDNYNKMFVNSQIGTVMPTPYMFLNARTEYEPIRSRQYVFDYETEEEARADELGWVTGGWALTCLAVSKTLGSYITTDVVGQCYLESDVAEMVADIEVPLRGFANQVIAKFVVCKRSLDTLDAYFDEL